MSRLLALLVAAVFVSGAQNVSMAEEKSMDRTITVSATGTVTAEPDEATISSGVSSEAKTAKDAMSANSSAMRKVISELKNEGVEAKDIQTTQFNVEPVYVYPKEGQPPVVTGYRVTNMVGVRVRDLNRLGGVLDKLVVVGANQMSGINFEVSKAEVLKDDARKDAVANALRRAKLIAAASGAEVGEVIQIVEDMINVGPRPVVFARDKASMAEAAPIERGSQQLESRVTVTWKLK